MGDIHGVSIREVTAFAEEWKIRRGPTWQRHPQAWNLAYWAARMARHRQTAQATRGDRRAGLSLTPQPPPPPAYRLYSPACLKAQPSLSNTAARWRVWRVGNAGGGALSLAINVSTMEINHVVRTASSPQFEHSR